MHAGLSRRDLVLLALLTLIWGLNWPVMKVGVLDFPPLAFRIICIVLGIVMLWTVAKLRGISLVVPREHWRELFMLAITNMAVWYVLAIYAIDLLSSGRAAILGYTLPVWSALLAVAMHDERPNARVWLGVSAAAGGVTLLLWSEFSSITGSPFGTLLMLVSAATWAVGTRLMRRRVVDRPILVLTFWMMVIALVICLPIMVVLEREQIVRAPNALEWAAVVYNGVLVFCAAQLVWFRLATILPPVASALSVMLIPVVGLFSGIWLLGEQPAWQDWAALGCVLLAIATVLRPKGKHAAVAEPLEKPVIAK